MKTACTLQEIPEELDVIHSIYLHFLQTHQTAEVASWLQNRGQLTRSGKKFSPASVRQILQNPVYCIADSDVFSYFAERNADLCFSPDSCSGQGLLAYNKRNYRQKGAPRQTEKHWIIAAGRHRGIICGRDWVTTQSLLSNCHRAPGNPDAPKGLLCSILYCRHCRRPMVSKRRSKNTDLPTYDYYLQQKAAPRHRSLQLSESQRTTDRRRHSADSLQHSAKASEYKYTSGSRQAVTT